MRRLRTTTNRTHVIAQNHIIANNNNFTSLIVPLRAHTAERKLYSHRIGNFPTLFIIRRIMANATAYSDSMTTLTCMVASSSCVLQRYKWTNKRKKATKKKRNRHRRALQWQPRAIHWAPVKPCAKWFVALANYYYCIIHSSRHKCNLLTFMANIFRSRQCPYA